MTDDELVTEKRTVPKRMLDELCERLGFDPNEVSKIVIRAGHVIVHRNTWHEIDHA